MSRSQAIREGRRNKKRKSGSEAFAAELITAQDDRMTEDRLTRALPLRDVTFRPAEKVDFPQSERSLFAN